MKENHHKAAWCKVQSVNKKSIKKAKVNDRQTNKGTHVLAHINAVR